MTPSNGAGGSGMKDFVSGLNEAIRENPIAAGLVGMGVLWMLMGTSRVSTIGTVLPVAVKGAAQAVGAGASRGAAAVSEGVSAVGSGISSVGSGIDSGLSSVASGISAVGARVAETASHARESLAAAWHAGDAADASNPGGQRSASNDRSDGPVNGASERLDAAWQSARHTGSELGTSLRHQLTDSLERQPLVLGAIGVAIGAGMAMAFPTTRMERDLMGEAATDARHRVDELVSETGDLLSSRGKDAVDAIKSEAQARGLTPDAARGAVQDIAGRAKSVASSAYDNLANRLS